MSVQLRWASSLRAVPSLGRLVWPNSRCCIPVVSPRPPKHIPPSCVNPRFADPLGFLACVGMSGAIVTAVAWVLFDFLDTNPPPPDPPSPPPPPPFL